MNNKTILILFSIFLLFFTACKIDSNHTTSDPVTTDLQKVKIPKFDKEAAFTFIEKQVAFGSRVPNSEAHEDCKDWLVQTFKDAGADVISQTFTAKAYTGTILNGTNIIAQINPQHKKRIILAAHWDSRHIGDKDENEARRDEPILAADDGGSGVGVLLEIAKQLQENPIDLGVDIILFDLEDYGDSRPGGESETWCLGSQYWSSHFHKDNYKAKYGILLDMVGARNARFPKEATSMQFAPKLMNKVWNLAAKSGYSSYFHDASSQGTTDDHYFVNTIAKIPMIDIINKPLNSKYGFGNHWHTHQDNMDIIDKRTLRAVGQTLLNVLYKEAEGKF